MAVSAASPLTIWRLLDGKPGHENQSLGLVNALRRLCPCAIHDIPLEQGRFKPLLYLLSGTYSPAVSLPAPDLIVAAGHRTHLHLLAAKRATGGRAIVLMKPSLPVALFDLVLIPEHDQHAGGDNLLETRGVLNPLESAGEHQADKALILIGGPSRHHDWDADGLLGQIGELLKANPNIDYLLTTSRRTPLEFVNQLRELAQSNLTVVPVDQTASGWVAKRLAESGVAWVTEDSVSMVYEALTAGVAVGVLSMPEKRESRVSTGLQQLIVEGLVCRYDEDDEYKNQLQPAEGFNEAERCARWIVEEWLKAS